MPLTPAQTASLAELIAEHPDAREAVFGPMTLSKWTIIAGQWVRAPMILTRNSAGWHERPAMEAANGTSR